MLFFWTLFSTLLLSVSFTAGDESLPLSRRNQQIRGSQGALRASHGASSFLFGAPCGVLRYFWPPNERPSTRADRLALGFITLQTDATLVRVESAAGLGDYLKLLIEDGRVAVVFNVGTEDICIQEKSTLVNDGELHTVRFSRSGGNASLQLDDRPAIQRFPVGRQLTIFNSQMSLVVGGWKQESMDCMFQGQMSGLYFNGLKLFNMALMRDPSVQMEGSLRPAGEMRVPLATEVLRLSESSTTSILSSVSHSPQPQTTAELEASAECPADDEDVESCELSSVNPSVPSLGHEEPSLEVFHESGGTMAMVLGIVLSAALCILILLYAMYKYRNREQASYLIQQQSSAHKHTSHGSYEVSDARVQIHTEYYV